MSSRIPRPRLQVILLLLILLLAGTLRLWRLDDLPPGLYHDEAYNGLDAISLIEGSTFPRFYEGWELYAEEAHENQPPQDTRWPVFFEGNYGREPLHIYLMALSISLFGPTPFAIRLVPALAGIFTVLAVYLAASALLSAPDADGPGEEWRMVHFSSINAPLIAALAAAILYPAVHFSRFGLRVMLFVPIMTFAVYFFWSGVNGASTQKKLTSSGIVFRFSVAGFFIGLGIYTYAAARLFPLVFLFFCLYWIWRDRSLWRRHRYHLLIMLTAAFFTALPLLLYFLRYPYFFILRVAYVANRGKGVVAGKPWLTWISNVGRVIRGLIWQGETHLRHNYPGRPFLDPIQSIFFTLGLISGLVKKQNQRIVFLWLWLLVMLLPSILSGDAPHFGRMIGAIPSVAIFSALGITWLSQLIASASNRRSYRIQQLVFILMMLASIFWTTNDYFVRYASYPSLAIDFYQADWELGRYAAAQPEESILYLSPTQAEMATIYFAVGGSEQPSSYNSDMGLIPAGKSGQPIVYLLRLDQKKGLENLQRFFPEGRIETQEDGFLSFKVPTVSDRLPGLQGTYLEFSDEIALRGWAVEQQETDLVVTLAWQAAADIGTDYTAYVHLLGNDGQLISQHDRQPAGYPTSEWRSGEIVVDYFRVQLPNKAGLSQFVLETGFYDLRTLEPLGVSALLIEDYELEQPIR